MKKLRFEINQKVKLKHSYTGCKTGIVVSITVLYTVKQDDGLVFEYTPGNLEESEIKQ